MAKRGPKGASKYTKEFIEKEAQALEKYIEQPEPFVPFECEFAKIRGYYSELLSKWDKTNDKFSQALKKMKDVQEHRLIKGGMTEALNVTMVIFTLKNVAGWRDKKDVEHSVDPDNPLKIIVEGVNLKKLAQNGK